MSTVGTSGIRKCVENILSLVPETALPTTKIDKIVKTESFGVYRFTYLYNHAELFFIEISKIAGEWELIISVYPNGLYEDGFAVLFEDDEQMLLEG